MLQRGATVNGAVPHPIPYQGSKRLLAGAILAKVKRRHVRVLFEPFSGSGALSLAAAQAGVAQGYVLGDSLRPLVEIWRAILHEPGALADGYEALWREQPEGDSGDHYVAVRARYNEEGGAARLLYLLARCVKNAPRWNTSGAFNQAPDRRRRGTRPEAMRAAILGASRLLSGRARVECGDFRETIAAATPEDLVYLDPPWQGTTEGQDKRYHEGLERDALVAALEALDARGVPFVLSYDGRCGERRYGAALPRALGLRRVELPAGRSSQATLLGRDELTIESLYLSRHLRARR